MGSCIICSKELGLCEGEECESCKALMDEKYKADRKGRDRSERFFRWLRRPVGEVVA